MCATGGEICISLHLILSSIMAGLRQGGNFIESLLRSMAMELNKIVVADRTYELWH